MNWLMGMWLISKHSPVQNDQKDWNADLQINKIELYAHYMYAIAKRKLQCYVGQR
jgi:hypothetical protein